MVCAGINLGASTRLYILDRETLTSEKFVDDRNK